MIGTLHLASNKCYGVMLHNAAEKDDEQLQIMLQEFGKVREIQRGGLNAFVYFKEYSEAKECLSALYTHGVYHAKPAKPKETNIDRKARDAQGKFYCARSETKPSRANHEGFHKQRDSKEERVNSSYKNYLAKEFPETSALIDEKAKKLYSKEGPPRLISATDLWEEQQAKQLICPAVVIVANLPVNINCYDLYKMCTELTDIQDIQIVKRDDITYLPYAKIGAASLEEAEKLVFNLNNQKVQGKTLKARIADSIFQKKK